jgi:hypothetical protein
MRNLLLTLSLVSTLQCIAQDPDPDLFQTWYLQDIFLEFTPPLGLIEPPIHAFLIISENLDFSGQGSCNTFTGTYLYDPSENSIGFIEFSRTNMDCIFKYHNQFETEYFATVKGPWKYEISEDGVGLQLNIYNILDSSATFTNYSLGTPDINKIEITIYPIPSHTEIFIESQNEPITRIELLNLLGENLQSRTDYTDSVDISGLASGIYLLRIFTEQGSIVKKIAKQ